MWICQACLFINSHLHPFSLEKENESLRACFILSLWEPIIMAIKDSIIIRKMIRELVIHEVKIGKAFSGIEATEEKIIAAASAIKIN